MKQKLRAERAYQEARERDRQTGGVAQAHNSACGELMRLLRTELASTQGLTASQSASTAGGSPADTSRTADISPLFGLLLYCSTFDLQV